MKRLKRYLDPNIAFIMLLFVLAFLDNKEMVPHLAVVGTACFAALLLVFWTRHLLSRRQSFPYVKLFEVLDDEVFACRENEHHSSMAHDGETELHCREAEALERLKKRLLREFKEGP